MTFYLREVEGHWRLSVQTTPAVIIHNIQQPVLTFRTWKPVSIHQSGSHELLTSCFCGLAQLSSWGFGCLCSNVVLALFNCLFTAKDCGAPPDIPRGVRSKTMGQLYNDRVYYECELGYRIVGNDSIVCTETGSWSHPPQCTSKKIKFYDSEWCTETFMAEK